MWLISKKISLVLLGITAVVGSRATFFFVDDPEGPNLLVVFVTASIVYFSSLAVVTRKAFASIVGLKRFLLTIVIQVVVMVVLYMLAITV